MRNEHISRGAGWRKLQRQRRTHARGVSGASGLETAPPRRPSAPPPGAAEAPPCVALLEAGAGSLCFSAPHPTRWAAAATHARALYCPPPIALPALAPHCRRRLGLARDWRVAVHWYPGRCNRPCLLPVKPGVVPSPPVWQRAGSSVQPSGLRLGPPPRREERSYRDRPGPARW